MDVRIDGDSMTVTVTYEAGLFCGLSSGDVFFFPHENPHGPFHVRLAGDEYLDMATPAVRTAAHDRIVCCLYSTDGTDPHARTGPGTDAP